MNVDQKIQKEIEELADVDINSMPTIVLNNKLLNAYKVSGKMDGELGLKEKMLGKVGQWFDHFEIPESLRDDLVWCVCGHSSIVVLMVLEPRVNDYRTSDYVRFMEKYAQAKIHIKRVSENHLGIVYSSKDVEQLFEGTENVPVLRKDDPNINTWLDYYGVPTNLRVLDWYTYSFDPIAETMINVHEPQVDNMGLYAQAKLYLANTTQKMIPGQIPDLKKVSNYDT